MVDKECQPPHRNHQELHSEGVVVSIICGLKLYVDQIYSGICTANVDNLHGCVVEGYEGSEQIQVTSSEHYGKQDLTLSRNTGTRPGFPYF